MNRLSKVICTVLLLCFLLCGCGEVELDTSSVVDTMDTLREISQEISTEEYIVNILEGSELEPEPVVTSVNIKMVGDCLMHSGLIRLGAQGDGSYNFDFMFENVKEEIESADISIINQETIFINDVSEYSGYPMFGSPIEVGIAEHNAGFDIICHATNHTIDKGIQGIEDTLQFWNENYPDMTILGIHSSEEEEDVSYLTVNDISLAFVNYTYGLNGLEPRREGNEYLVDMLIDDDIESTMEDAVNNSDMVIAILHVGDEYVYEPSYYAVEQVDRFIDLGADVVICAHPHVIEPYEMRTTESGNTALVYYSLGNFISQQDEVPRMLGGMADFTILKVDEDIYIDSYEMVPLITHRQTGYVTTYLLDDYTDELASKHKLGLTVDSLWDLWYDIVGE